MKKIIILIVIALGLSSTVFCQQQLVPPDDAAGLRFNRASMAESPFCQFMDADKLIQLHREGLFLYSSLKGENGDMASGYDNNEDHIVTITNADSRKIMLKSSLFLTHSTSDVLEVFDGADTTAPLVKTFSGYLDKSCLIISSGDALTLRFRSDGSGTSKGFRFRVDEGPGIYAAAGAPLPSLQSCASTPAADECVNAPLICDLSGYCGNTSSAYTPGNTSGLSSFCGSIENNSWLSFIASSTVASLGFTSSGCQDNNSGIQATIYASSNCTSFTQVSNCVSQSSSSGSFTITTSTALVPGQLYYVMVDGYAGNVCSYSVTAQSGVALTPQITASQTQVCPGNSATLSSSIPASSYTWTSSPPGVYPNAQTITVTPGSTTTYTLQIPGNSCVPAGGSAVQTIQVTNTLSPANITAPSQVCYNYNLSMTSLTNGGTYNWTGPNGFSSNVQSPAINNWTSSNNGVYTLTINYGAGCATQPATVNITGSSSPTVNLSVTPSATLCAGQSVTITASGGTGLNPYNWNWNLLQTSITLQSCTSVFGVTTCVNNPLFSVIPGTSSTGPKGVVTPNQSTQICVSTTNAAGCIGQQCVNLVVLPATPSLTISPSVTICPSQSATLSVSGGSSYTWTPATGLSSTSSGTVTATPTITTTYTVTAPGCSSTQSQTVTVAVNGTPPNIGAIQGPTLVCSNATGITYSVTNVASTNYTWTVPPGVNIVSGANSNVLTVDYGASAGTISVTASTSCGTSTAALVVALSPALSLTVTPSNPSTCPGGSVTLTANGATSYTWGPSGSLSSPNGSSVDASPASTTTYTVNGATGSCTGSTTVMITVGANLNITIAQSTPATCAAGSTTLTASGAAGYTWTPAASLNASTGSTVVASPASTTIYTLTGATGACTGSAVVSVMAGITLSASTTQTNVSCNGLSDGTASAAASGGTGPYTYTWSTVPVQNTQTATGLAAGNYTVTVGSTQCSASGVELVSNGDFGAGNTGFSSSYAYTPPPNTQEGQYWVATGAQVSSWNGGMFSSGDHTSGTGNFMLVNGAATPNTDVWCQTISVTPNTDYLFSTWVSSLNSSVPAQLQFYINGAPLGSVFSSPPGPNVWVQFFSSWNSGANTSITICIINQNNSTLGNDFGLDDISFQQCMLPCPVTQTVTITEPPAVTVTATGNATICPGQSTSLLAGGAASYTWSPSASLNASNTATVSANPSATTVYTVSGADAGGCTATNTVQVDVAASVSLTLTPTTASICPGQSVTLTAAGAASYTWSPSASLSAASGSTVSASPPATTVYTVVGSNASGCLDSTTATVNLGGVISISVTPASATICPSSSVTLSASGATSYTWSPSASLSAANSSTVDASPAATTVYTITGDNSGCSGTTTATVTVSNTLAVTATAANSTICPAGSTPLNASGAASYTWSPAGSLGAANGATVTASPAASTQYTVLGASGTCTSTATVDVAVAASPTISASASPTICSGSNAALSANGASTYTWTPAAGLSSTSGANVSAGPNTTTTYTINGSSALGCTSSTVITVNVVATPTVSALSSQSSICDGKSTSLSGFGAASFTWSPAASLSAANSAVVTGTPHATTIYTLTGENGLAPNTCQSTATVQVTVVPQVTAAVSPNQSICFGSRTYLVASGGSTYTWTPSTGLSGTHTPGTYAEPLINTTYTVTVSNGGQCPGTATVSVIVNPLPALNAGRDTTINIDEYYEITGSGAGTIGWLPVDVPYACNYCAQETVNPQHNTCYVLEATDSLGCVNRDTMCITVTKDWDVFIPNAFTPNGNNVNDVFIPVGYGIKTIHLYIFDRWGEQIFKSSDTQQGWDGKNKGKLCETGIYIYQVEIETMEGPTVKRVGHVTLLSSIK